MGMGMAIKGAAGAAGSIGLINKAMKVSSALGGNTGVNLAGIIARNAHTGANTLTASTLAYTEGAMSGAAVYQSVMQNMIAQGASPEDAEKRAMQAAEATVEMNTLINTFLNYSSVKHFFGSSQDIASHLGKEASEQIQKAAAKGATDDVIKQIDDIAFKGKTGKDRALDYLKEAGKEGVEEWVNVISEKAGEQ